MLTKFKKFFGTVSLPSSDCLFLWANGHNWVSQNGVPLNSGWMIRFQH